MNVLAFKKRRQQLMKQAGKGSVIILSSSEEIVRSRDTHFPFRQNSDFLYLTGFNEPTAIMVLVPGRKEGEFILFNRERNREMETWYGYRTGQEGAVETYGANEAYSIEDIDEVLPKLLKGKSAIFYAMGQTEMDVHVVDWIKMIEGFERGTVKAPRLEDITPFLSEMRLIKSPVEQKLMRQAAKVSAQSHIRAMRNTCPGKTEKWIEGEITHEYYQHGISQHAYSPIVAGGSNACTLHYIENNAVLSDGDLLLIDAGCELEGYASDITRTFPVNGKFTKEQAALYDIVLEAQQKAIKLIKPGNRWNQPHDAAVRVITQGLLDLGLLKGELNTLITEHEYRKFYMHKTGHWIGLDVHDVGSYEVDGKPRRFEAGMVLTVEPGIYVAPDTKGVAKKWKGIGIRIEDDILVTKQGCEVMTEDVPKTRHEIEALMSIKSNR